jgi:large subunit ribosomal protein L21
VLQHLKEIKLSFQKKKKRIQKRNGHRQYLTQILIEGISKKAVQQKKVIEQSPKKKRIKKELDQKPQKH